MEDNFEQLIAALNISPLSTDILHQIKHFLQQQTNECLASFISQSFQSLVTLEHWAWQFLCQDFHPKIEELHYQELFDALASFNMMLIFNNNHIEADIISSLFLPETIECINQIFEQIEKTKDDNDPFLLIISRWFDNLSYLIHEHTQFETLPIIIHISQYVGHNYLLSDQYKLYLNQLRQSQIPQTVFTAKQLFYIKTCSFIFRMYACSKGDKLPFKADELLDRFGDDYLQIIFVHNHTVHLWSKEFLTCITHLLNFICACCWWGNDQAVYVKLFLPSQKLRYDYIQALIRIVSYKSFHERIISQWSNDETILIDSILIFLMGALLQMKNLSCFIRSETNLSNLILIVAQKSCYDRISLCAYGILAEILSDEQLKEVKITNNITEFFFGILEHAWKLPTQRYKRIQIPQLLTGFLTLSKNDSIQQKTADSNKILLLIEMSDKYPIAFDIIWALSFNSDIQHQLRSNTAFMSKLTLLKEEYTNENMRKITFGILWNLESNHEDREIPDIDDGAMFDIMISYSHRDETICKQLYAELLKAGYRIWIDFDQIHGNIMDAMAQAIEQSHIIIICMSEQYRRSNYCRAEAHYAFQRQRKIVPVLLQEHYEPDGWLLFLIGQLLYVDFTKHEFPRAMELLIEELKAPERPETQAIPVQEEPDVALPPSTELSILPRSISDWTGTHVQNWLIGYNLRQMARLLSDFDGPSLISLHEFMTSSDPQQILTSFQEDSHRRLHDNISLLELARFRTLLNQRYRLFQLIETQQLTKKNKLNPFTHCQIL